jgi:hypothetical protein
VQQRKYVLITIILCIVDCSDIATGFQVANVDPDTVVYSDGKPRVKGTTATYTCLTGYTCTGTCMVSCGNSGKWSTPTFTCESKCKMQHTGSEVVSVEKQSPALPSLRAHCSRFSNYFMKNSQSTCKYTITVQFTDLEKLLSYRNKIC